MKLRQLLKEIILFEISLDQIQTQFVDTGKLSARDFEKIKEASGGDSAYATWLVARVVGSKRQSPLIKSEDIYKYKNYLTTFKLRRKEFPFNDINQIKSPQDLAQFITTAVNLKNQEEEDPSQIKGITKSEKYSKLKIGEIGGFAVYKIPKGATQLKQVACDLGSGTQWCTADSRADYFEEYIEAGPLYIFDNGKGEKYQFSYETLNFMDKYDAPVFGVNGNKTLIVKLFQYLENIGEQKIPLTIKLINPDFFSFSPKDLNVKGDFMIPDNILKDFKLPDNLMVSGDFQLDNTNIRSFPKNLQVGGDLYFTATLITSVPNDLKVGGSIYLGNNKITSFPDNLPVKGTLSLIYTKITSLPDNLKIGGNLDLSNTPITFLPKNLQIGEDLYLSNTKITSLPKDLQVGGDVMIGNTPLAFSLSPAEETEFRKKFPGIKGKIKGIKEIIRFEDNGVYEGNVKIENRSHLLPPNNIEFKNDLLIYNEVGQLPQNSLKVGDDFWLAYIKDTTISFPKNLQVGGNFSIFNNLDKEVGSSIKVLSYPNNFEVKGNFSARNNVLTSLPSNLKIGGNLDLNNTKITSLPKDLQVGGNINLLDTPLSSKTEAEIRQMAPGIKGDIILTK
jgi:hypothetical protein